MFLYALACAVPSQDSADTSDTGESLDTDTGPIDDTGWEDPLALGALSGDCPLLTEVWGNTDPQLLETALSLDEFNLHTEAVQEKLVLQVEMCASYIEVLRFGI